MEGLFFFHWISSGRCGRRADYVPASNQPHKEGCETTFNLKDHLWMLFLYKKGIFDPKSYPDDEYVYDGCNCGRSLDFFSVVLHQKQIQQDGLRTLLSVV